jgi:hypothetical protein
MFRRQRRIHRRGFEQAKISIAAVRQESVSWLDPNRTGGQG